eukprot:295943-Pelagomonas_calceolata.AAC.3
MGLDLSSKVGLHEDFITCLQGWQGLDNTCQEFQVGLVSGMGSECAAQTFEIKVTEEHPSLGKLAPFFCFTTGPSCFVTYGCTQWLVHASACLPSCMMHAREYRPCSISLALSPAYSTDLSCAAKAGSTHLTCISPSFPPDTNGDGRVSVDELRSTLAELSSSKVPWAAPQGGISASNPSSNTTSTTTSSSSSSSSSSSMGDAASAGGTAAHAESEKASAPDANVDVDVAGLVQLVASGADGAQELSLPEFVELLRKVGRWR